MLSSDPQIHCNLYQNPKDNFYRNRKKQLKLTRNLKRLHIAKTILKVNKKTEGLTLPGLNKATVFHIVW